MRSALLQTREYLQILIDFGEQAILEKIAARMVHKFHEEAEESPPPQSPEMAVNLQDLRQVQ